MPHLRHHQKTADVRSVKSIILELTSALITSACRNCPLRIILSAILNPNTNPAQAALTSNATAFFLRSVYPEQHLQ